MASLIETVKRQALITFSSKVSLSFEENLTKLKNLASKLTSADVKLDIKSLLSIECDSECQPNLYKNRLAPVTYIEVFKNPDITIGIFVLRSGARLPLHDHPLMYGLLKVISGTVHIHSYSPISRTVPESEQFGDNVLDFSGDFISPLDLELSSKSLSEEVSLLAMKEPEMYLDEKDEACVLCPRQGNIHEIHSVNGPAAFVDILAPPYNTDIPGVGPRPCRYFKDITVNESTAIKKLVRIPDPEDYWSDSAPYEGPPCRAEN